MDESSRRSVLKAGAAAIGGLFGAGVVSAAGGLTRDRKAGTADNAPAKAQSNMHHAITLHGSRWHVASPNRASGEFPDAGEHMLIQGELLDQPIEQGGKKVGDFYATYFAVAGAGQAAVDGAASLQTHTFTLPDGQIIGTGTATDGHDTVDSFAIVGGTGKYA